MFSKIVFVLATVCVINASVLTVNVFDDDPGTELANNPKDCNFRACDQLCRRLKFTGGACVNGRCKCDKFLNAEDGVSEKSLSNVEDPVSQQDDPEAEVAARPSKCNLTACDLVCRWLKKKRGSCVDGRCTCAKSLVAEGDMTDPAEFLSPGSCNSIACDDKCRRTGWHSGVCIKGQCKCDYFLNTEDAVTESTLSNLEDSISPRRCTYQACNNLCRRLKFTGGACVNGRCKCDKFLNAEDGVSEKSLTSVEDPVSQQDDPEAEVAARPSKCNLKACDLVCRWLKKKSGSCVDGRCTCAKSLVAEDAVDEYSEFPIRVCRLSKCRRKCTRRGYDVAKCVNGRCKCYKKTQAKDASLLNDVTSDENEESNDILRTNEEEPTVLSPRACNTVTCNQMCHRLNYAGGWCRFGQCQCY